MCEQWNKKSETFCWGQLLFNAVQQGSTHTDMHLHTSTAWRHSFSKLHNDSDLLNNKFQRFNIGLKKETTKMKNKNCETFFALFQRLGNHSDICKSMWKMQTTKNQAISHNLCSKVCFTVNTRLSRPMVKWRSQVYRSRKPEPDNDAHSLLLQVDEARGVWVLGSLF